MRIHELAKELELKAKDLYPHLKKLGIEFKNHMSAISEDDIARVKNALNPPTSEKIVEKRLRPTLIRRRRKKVEAEPPSPAEEQEISAEEPVIEETPQEVQPVEEVEQEQQKKEVKKEETPPKKKTTRKKEAAVAAPEKPPQIKIVGKKDLQIDLEVDKEEEEEDKKRKGRPKKRKPRRERFVPAEDLAKKKLTTISSKDFQEDEPLPEEPAKVYKPTLPRKKKPLTLVKT
ncbi:MAG: translation initiation factor IF-2 N-terminal domain-containing protein, partial [Thermodesulfobacteriota bacterium]|nr:translation initiation factor IF-2 N-terminal domain-containing protein [Thermodesulfobacteriota bacterium]